MTNNQTEDQASNERRTPVPWKPDGLGAGFIVRETDERRLPDSVVRAGTVDDDGATLVVYRWARERLDGSSAEWFHADLYHVLGIGYEEEDLHFGILEDGQVVAYKEHDRTVRVARQVDPRLREPEPVDENAWNFG